jgi:hypothetical protein
MEIKRRALAVIVGLSTAALLAGCQGDVATATSSSPTPSHQPPASAPDPSIREAKSASPEFDVGHTVHMTAAGIQPRLLVSLCCNPVVFKNESGAKFSVIFDISKINSGSIAPGASWQWVPPNAESVTYHLSGASKTHFQIQVEAPNW